MGSAPVRTMVVWCLDWPVVAHGVGPGDPAAVLHANRVVACTPAARAVGVHRGLRRREAQGRCPELVVLERDLASEARAFEPVAAAIEAFAPRLEITRPGSCAVPTRGPSRYFGGDDALGVAVRERVAGVLDGRTECRIGIADGPFAAGLAARSGTGADEGAFVVPPGDTPAFLAPMPITTLERPDLVEVLVRLGLRTLGAFAALPAADVLGRFGTDGIEAHRLAAGRDERPPDARHPPPDLHAERHLDPPVEHIEHIAFTARELADELHAALDERGLSCTRVAIEAETEHGEHLVRLWRHEGALSAAMLADRVRWQLDGWLNMPAASRPSGGLVRLALVPDEVVPARGRQLGFWGGETAADERAGRALARVQALLGPEAVCVPERHGGRGPGEQFRLVPVAGVELVGREVGATPRSPSTGTARRDGAPPWPGVLPAPSPSVVHPDALPATVTDARGRTVSVTGRGLVSAAPAVLTVGRASPMTIDAWAGPWLVEERWWDAGAERRLARFQVCTDAGTAHLLALEGGQWWVEATYD